jgi:uncharacterized protein (TIGR02569 family)
VLQAFGVHDTSLRRLAGGQGGAWVAGTVVLKPGGGEVHEWLASALTDVATDGFRLAAPVRTVGGAWACQGWTASRWVEGEDPDRAATSTWVEIVEAGRAFHRAVAMLPRPAFLEARTDPWARADRVAWGERPVRFGPELATLVLRLKAGLEPLGRSQVVHGDLTTNVLCAPGLPPALIDVSPYWRPPAYAEGVVVADALCWHGAPPDLLALSGVPVAAVARALLFRLATTQERAASAAAGIDLRGEATRCSLAAAAIGL